MAARRLKIAVTADPDIPVPPRLYGGIERIVHMLLLGLIAQGHEVTLFAHPKSDPPCKLAPYPNPGRTSKSNLINYMWHVSSKIIRGRYDLVHSFGRLAYLLPVLPLPVPKLMSYQRAVTARSVEWSERLARGTLHFTGCSRQLVGRYANNANWHVVYNGVPLAMYQFRNEVGVKAPLVFLGRIDRTKGPHVAIEVARKAGRPLVIAGNCASKGEEKEYFEQEIGPQCDGRQIKYIGPVTDAAKNELLGRAAALLFPIEWEEPFGIVMVEALACGTPVIAFPRGSVPEIIEHRVNGFLCDSVESMIKAVRNVPSIDRARCREICEKRFSDRVIVDQYERLYRKIVQLGPQ